MSAVLALALGAHLEAGPIRLEVKGEAVGVGQHTSLRGAVARRLLEDGHALTDEGVDTAVTIRRLRDSVLIVVRSGDIERVEEVPAAREDLLRLEVSHRVQVMLEDVPARPGDDRPTAAVGFRGRAPTDAEVHQATRPLVDAGFAVVGEQTPADWAVCVTWQGESYRVERGPAPPCEDVLPAGATGAELGSLVAGQARALWVDEEAREVTELAALANTIPEQKPQPQPQPQPDAERNDGARVDEPAGVTPAGRQWFAVAVFGGVQLRPLAAESTFGTDLSGGAGLWGGRLRLSFTPSSTLGLEVLDTFLSAGPTLRGHVGRRVSLSAGVLGGVLLHRFVFQNAAAVVRVDAQVQVPLAMAVHLAQGFGLRVGAHVGAASRSREHTVGGAPLWSRGAVRWGATLGVEYAFGPREAARR